MTDRDFSRLVRSIETGGNVRFDRFAICAAYYWYAVNYHDGQGSKWYAVFERLEKIGFKPGTAVEFGRLDETARAIFDRLVETHGRG